MKMKNPESRIVVGISGASGSLLAAKTVDALLNKNVGVSLVASNPARIVWQHEMSISYGENVEEWSYHNNFEHFAIGDFKAPIASGTYPTAGMAIVPSSMATISAVAKGLSDNLMRRAADVCLKERRPLVMVPRESPLNAIHLDNMKYLATLGVAILPSDPPYYLPITTLEEAANFTVQRILMALGIIDQLPEEMQYRGPII